MQEAFLGSVDSGWVIALVAAASAIAGAIAWIVQRWRQERESVADQATREAQAPANEMTAASRAAEAIAGAAAQLLAPFQATVVQQQSEITRLQGAIELSRTAEERCLHDLEAVKTKLREVTDHLGLDPDGLKD